jgi:hypothetical protein
VQQTAEQLIQKFSDFLEASGNLGPGGTHHLLRILTGLPVQTLAQLIAHCSESFNSDTVASDALVKLLLLGAWLALSESKAASA